MRIFVFLQNHVIDTLIDVSYQNKENQVIPGSISLQTESKGNFFFQIFDVVELHGDILFMINHPVLGSVEHRISINLQFPEQTELNDGSTTTKETDGELNFNDLGAVPRFPLPIFGSIIGSNWGFN